MAILKQKEETFEEVSGYSELSLLRFVQNMNIRAWIVMLVWLSFNAVFGFLYLTGQYTRLTELLSRAFDYLDQQPESEGNSV